MEPRNGHRGPLLCTLALAASVAFTFACQSDNGSAPDASLSAGSATATARVAGSPPGATVPVGPTASLAPSPTAFPMAPAGLCPAGTRTGVSSVDHALAAIESRDLRQIESTFHYQPVPCRAGEATGFPTCPAGVPAGTLVDGLLTAQCHLGWVPRFPLIPAELETFLLNGTHLRSVARIKPTAVPLGEGFFPEIRYLVIYAAKSGPQSSYATLGLDNDGVVFFNRGCGSADVDENLRDSRIGTFEGFLLAPKP